MRSVVSSGEKSCGARTSRTFGYVPELEWPTPAKTWGVVEAKVVTIAHAACKGRVRAARACDVHTHLVTTPVIQGFRRRILGVIYSALARRTK